MYTYVYIYIYTSLPICEYMITERCTHTFLMTTNYHAQFDLYSLITPANAGVQKVPKT